MNNKNRLGAVTCALLAVAFYAVSTPFSKLLLDYATPTFIAAFLYLGAGCIGAEHESIPTKKWVIDILRRVIYNISKFTWRVVNLKKEALLLIDIQDVYFTPGPLLLNEPRKAAKKAAELLQQFRLEKKRLSISDTISEHCREFINP